MLLLVIGLTWCATSAVAFIPPWSPSCPQESNIPNACVYGNLKVSLFRNLMLPKDCNHQVSVKEFVHFPIIHIDTTNSTEMFTVVMVDLGPEGRGPNYLKWMVTNVTVHTLPLSNIPLNNVLASYNPPSLEHNANHRTLVQILVFRHHNILKVPFGQFWVTPLITNFSFSTLFSNTYPNLRLCGPVAGTQFWLYDPDRTPSAPPAAPPQPGVQLSQPVQPIYIPVVPVVPVGQAPPPPPPAAHPAPGQQQHAHTTFPKKSSASLAQPKEILFIPLVILTVMCL